MGNKIEVWAWVKDGFAYRWLEYPEYAGRSLARALWAGWRAKRRGVGYVKIEWR